MYIYPKKLPGIPVIEIPITSYDIVRAMAECTQSYQCKKIAFIGNYSNMSDIEGLNHLFENKILIYSPQTAERIESAVEQAIAVGCDAIIGSKYVVECAKEHLVNSKMILVGKESISPSINEALKLIDVLNDEIEQAEI